MAIDLNACIGCNACVVACQAENNIPVVGTEQVVRGREMHWIRIDRYFTRRRRRTRRSSHQPVACQHCENAPCEQVCPVAATVHSREGLNDMVYNRCIGTRYCSNNCPYKVRRFNFFNYHKDLPRRSRKMAAQPRGHRAQPRRDGEVHLLRAADRGGEDRGRRTSGGRSRDGEIAPACPQACPTQAIVFGDLNDPTSRGRAAARRSPQPTRLLAELNIRPRTALPGPAAQPGNPRAERSRRSDHGRRRPEP